MRSSVSILTLSLLLGGCYVGVPRFETGEWDGGTAGDTDAAESQSTAAGDGSGGTATSGTSTSAADDNGNDESGGNESGGDESGGVPGEDGICGDGVVQSDEECDQGAGNDDMQACKSDCTSNVCGDGYVGPGEGCDDGNLSDGDACTSDCALASCGDGILDDGEACDDGNANDDDSCTSACTEATCGDGFAQADSGEECDLGAENSDAEACTTACLNAVCGDGLVWYDQEECDDGPANASDAECTAGCMLNVCGDGNMGPGEQCDDGNNSSSDVCTNACLNAQCGDGFVQPGEACDDGNNSDIDACSNACEQQAGDGIPDNAYCNAVTGWTPAWSAWEQQVLTLVNEARSTPTDCGSEGNFAATSAVAYNGALTCSARNHSLDMGENDFFDHTNLDGESPGVRITKTGYSWSTYGENIAAGQNSPSNVVAGWLDSDGHCSNIMNPDFEELGVGYYYAPGSMYSHYWTQNFATHQ